MSNEFKKGRAEKELYSIDFAAELEAGESVTLIVSFDVTDPFGVDAKAQFHIDDAPAPLIVGTAVTFWLRKAAAADEQMRREYQITLVVRTSLGRELEARVEDARPLIRMLL